MTWWPFDGVDLDWEWPQNFASGGAGDCSNRKPCGCTGNAKDPCRVPYSKATAQLGNGTTVDVCSGVPFQTCSSISPDWQVYIDTHGQKQFEQHCKQRFGTAVCSIQTGDLGLGSFPTFQRWGTSGMNDWTAYVDTIKALKAALGPDKTVTAAVGMSPSSFTGPPWKDFCDSVDFVHCMTYDYYGPWGPTNFLSPLYQIPSVSCWSQGFSASQGIDYMINQGCTPSKMLIGIPAYGKSWKITNSGSSEEGIPNLCVPSLGPGPGTFPGAAGTLDYWDLQQNYVPSVGGRPNAYPGDAFACRQPYCVDYAVGTNSVGSYTLYRYEAGGNLPVLVEQAAVGAEQVWISYADPVSVGAQVEYAKEKGLGGYFIWEAEQDREGTLGEAAYNSWTRDRRSSSLQSFFGFPSAFLLPLLSTSLLSSPYVRSSRVIQGSFPLTARSREVKGGVSSSTSLVPLSSIEGRPFMNVTAAAKD